jgi:hypothetical protein
MKLYSEIYQRKDAKDAIAALPEHERAVSRAEEDQRRERWIEDYARLTSTDSSHVTIIGTNAIEAQIKASNMLQAPVRPRLDFILKRLGRNRVAHTGSGSTGHLSSSTASTA